LTSFAENIRKVNRDNSEKEYSLFYPVLGKDFIKERSLLIVGQATNGWNPNFSVLNVLPDNIDTLVSEALNYSKEEEGKCALDWINNDWSKYKLYRSFFWNVTYKVVQEHYGRGDRDWNNIIAWSNLMKIAPTEGGNPDYAEREAQLESCSRLFQQEINDLKPKNVVIMTNLETWAAPVLDRAGIIMQRKSDECVEAVGMFHGTKIIVTKRLYVAKHRPFVDSICAELV